MRVRAVVLDSGVLQQLSTDRDFRRRFFGLVQSGMAAVIPTVVLAEAITGRPLDAATNQTIKLVGTTVDTDEALARRAGALRHRAANAGARRIPSAIDAIVAAHAADAGVGVVFTTDPTDLERLLADYPKVHVQKP